MRSVTLVTGAARGIGAATAHLLAGPGQDLALNYRSDHAAAEALAEALRARGSRVLLLPADVADPQQVARMFERVDAEFGRLTGLVNNAGIVAPSTGVQGIDRPRLERLFAVNVFGTLYCIQQAARRMGTASGGAGGVIVNVSSRAAQLGSPGVYVDYAATKGAVDSLTVGLGRELIAQGIRVNGVRPGIIETDIHADSGTEAALPEAARAIPIGRLGRADEVAQAIVWLLSPAASYLVGTTLDVAGGR